MAGVIGNLVYRISVSAIVGAIVAGGIIYLNNNGVVKKYQAEHAAQVEVQNLTDKAMLEANETLASAIAVVEQDTQSRMDEFSGELAALTVLINDMADASAVTTTPTDNSEVLAAIADLATRISTLESQLSSLAQE